MVVIGRIDETIVAISTASGFGAVGIVRLSGPRAMNIVEAMSDVGEGGKLSQLERSTRVDGEVFVDAQSHLPATFYVFRAPHSYTRQDIVEIQTVGAPVVLEMVRCRAIELGAVPAQPGEFTARAFMKGAMDLASAEAVAGVIRAQTDTQLRAARRMMDGALAKRVATLRDSLAELLALVEADIDFSEEPIEFITPPALRESLASIGLDLKPMLDPARVAERLEVLPHILLLGSPNAGKSTLMNRLSGTDRAICAAVAGTTRDLLSAPVRLGQIDAVLLDAAGVDESDRRSLDEIAAAAQEMTLSAAQRVDLICVVLDLTKPEDDAVFAAADSVDAPAVVVAANKMDTVSREAIAVLVEKLRSRGIGPVVPISALEGTGIDVLRGQLETALGSAATTTRMESEFLTERQQTGIREASEAIARAESLCESMSETIDQADLLAFELREALDTLGTVTGEVTTEDLLAHVFANFCIGK